MGTPLNLPKFLLSHFINLCLKNSNSHTETSKESTIVQIMTGPVIWKSLHKVTVSAQIYSFKMKYANL